MFYLLSVVTILACSMLGNVKEEEEEVRGLMIRQILKENTF